MHHHTWRLEQVVRAYAGALRLADIELQPYDYREETDAEGALRRAALAYAEEVRAAERSG